MVADGGFTAAGTPCRREFGVVKVRKMAEASHCASRGKEMRTMEPIASLRTG